LGIGEGETVGLNSVWLRLLGFDGDDDDDDDHDDDDDDDERAVDLYQTVYNYTKLSTPESNHTSFYPRV
jgi:hypothetical protein